MFFLTKISGKISHCDGKFVKVVGKASYVEDVIPRPPAISPGEDVIWTSETYLHILHIDTYCIDISVPPQHP